MIVRWPWPKQHRPATTTQLQAAEEITRQLEKRVENVDRAVRRNDPWASAILDTINKRGRSR